MAVEKKEVIYIGGAPNLFCVAFFVVGECNSRSIVFVLRLTKRKSGTEMKNHSGIVTAAAQSQQFGDYVQSER